VRDLMAGRSRGHGRPKEVADAEADEDDYSRNPDPEQHGDPSDCL